MITFQVEKWRPFHAEAGPIMQRHWEEIAIDRDKIQFSLDNARYEGMDDAGILHILTVRDSGNLMGYYIAFILPHVHYQHAGLMAFTDAYYVLPEARRGPVGMQLFAEAEKSLKERGVVKTYLSTKVHHDNGPLFERLGWKLTDRVYTKVFN